MSESDFCHASNMVHQARHNPEALGLSQKELEPGGSQSLYSMLSQLRLQLTPHDSDQLESGDRDPTSALLAELVVRKNLNVLRVNLYPNDEGYSLELPLPVDGVAGPDTDEAQRTNADGSSASDGADTQHLKQKPGKKNVKVGGHSGSKVNSAGKDVDSMVKTESGANVNGSSGRNSRKKKEVDGGGCGGSRDEKLYMETPRLSYDDTEFLECLDRGEIPAAILDLLDKHSVNLFYDGNILTAVVDRRHDLGGSPRTHYVILKYTQQTLLSDFHMLTETRPGSPPWTEDEKRELYARLTTLMSGPLCLDPSPAVAIGENMILNQSQPLNTQSVHRVYKKNSQAAENRVARNALAPNPPCLPVLDFIKKRKAQDSSTLKVDSWKRVKITPEPLATETVTKFAHAIPKPPEQKGSDHTSVAREEYVLETERNRGTIYYTRVVVKQRRSDDFYQGELHVDKDYKEGQNKASSCVFDLGSRAEVDRYVNQFLEIFTEEGQRPVKITHVRPGFPTRVSRTPAAAAEHRLRSGEGSVRGIVPVGIAPGVLGVTAEMAHTEALASLQGSGSGVVGLGMAGFRGAAPISLHTPGGLHEVVPGPTAIANAISANAGLVVQAGPGHHMQPHGNTATAHLMQHHGNTATAHLMQLAAGGQGPLQITRYKTVQGAMGQQLPTYSQALGTTGLPAAAPLTLTRGGTDGGGGTPVIAVMGGQPIKVATSAVGSSLHLQHSATPHTLAGPSTGLVTWAGGGQVLTTGGLQHHGGAIAGATGHTLNLQGLGVQQIPQGSVQVSLAGGSIAVPLSMINNGGSHQMLAASGSSGHPVLAAASGGGVPGSIQHIQAGVQQQVQPGHGHSIIFSSVPLQEGIVTGGHGQGASFVNVSGSSIAATNSSTAASHQGHPQQHQVLTSSGGVLQFPLTAQIVPAANRAAASGAVTGGTLRTAAGQPLSLIPSHQLGSSNFRLQAHGAGQPPKNAQTIQIINSSLNQRELIQGGQLLSSQPMKLRASAAVTGGTSQQPMTAQHFVLQQQQQQQHRLVQQQHQQQIPAGMIYTPLTADPARSAQIASNISGAAVVHPTGDQSMSGVGGVGTVGGTSAVSGLVTVAAVTSTLTLSSGQSGSVVATSSPATASSGAGGNPYPPEGH